MISVIIPVYNSRPFLPGLIKSLQTQTIRDLEFIFINDGSTDGSAELLDSFAQTDHRVRVIHKENGGVSSARNMGLDVASGEYITFADSDDTLEPDLYETLLRLVEEYQVKLAHCSYNRISNGVIKPIGNSGKIHIQSQVDALRELTCGSLFMGGCCNKLYDRELFEGVRFDTSLKLSEDELVNFQVFDRTESIVYQDVCKYNYLASETSACRNTPSLRKAQDHVKAAERIWELNRHPELEQPLRNKRLGAWLEQYKALVYEGCKDRELMNSTASQIHRLIRAGAVLSWKQALVYGLIRVCPAAFLLLYGIYDRIRVIE